MHVERTVAVVAVSILVATTHIVSCHFDALLVRAIVALFADQLALTSRGVADLVSGTVSVAAANATPFLAHEVTTFALVITARLAFASIHIAIAVCTVIVTVATADLVAIHVDTLRVGAVVSSLAFARCFRNTCRLATFLEETLFTCACENDSAAGVPPHTLSD